MASIVTREASSIARETQDALVARDIQGLAFVALSAAAGVVVAQEIADRVLPLLGFSREPTTSSGFAVSGLVKFVVALGAGVAATSLSGAALAVVAFVGLGHLAGAGADAFNAIQRTGFFAEAPSMGGNEQTATRTRAANTTRQQSQPTAASGTDGTATVQVG